MQDIVRVIANAAKAETNNSILGSLGINGQMLLFQSIAFLLLVVILSKWVFPVLMKAVDDRQEAIDASTNAAAEAEKRAMQAETKIDAAMKDARAQAKDIVGTAKDEAAAMVVKAEQAAKAKSERIVAEAHEDIAKEVEKAKKTLQSDTLALVKKATGAVTAHIADDKIDAAIVKKSVEGAKQ